MEFNVRPVAKVCSASGAELMPGHPCWSVLVEEDGKIVRHDFSADAWNGPPDGVIGYWECLVPDRQQTSGMLPDTDALFEYFVQLSEAPNHVEQDYRYVLALLLLRKRRLILEESVIIEECPAMRLTGTGGEGPFDVPERNLSEERIEQLQNQLFQGSAA